MECRELGRDWHRKGWGRSCEAFQVMDENMNLKRSIGTSKESKQLKQVDVINVCKKKKITLAVV